MLLSALPRTWRSQLHNHIVSLYPALLCRKALGYDNASLNLRGM